MLLSRYPSGIDREPEGGVTVDGKTERNGKGREEVPTSPDDAEAPPPGEHGEERGDRGRYWRVREIPETLFFRASFRTHAFRRHSHPQFALGVILRGTESFYCSGARRYAPEGSLVAVDPGRVHDGEPLSREEGFVYRMLYPTEEAIRSTLAGTALADRLPLFGSDPVVEDPDLARRLLALHRDLEAGGTGRAMELQSRTAGLLRCLFARHGRKAPEEPDPLRSPEAIRTAQEYLRAHFAEDVSLDDASAAAGLSRFHFLRLFKRTVGVPPHLFLVQLRVEGALREIREGTPMAEAASAAGFADQSHFARWCRAFYGVPPRVYLRSLLP
jgi:AraC-like DNA-binding protein